MEFLDTLDKILTPSGGAILTITMVLEFVFRMIPSKKPLSILWIIAKLAGRLGGILVKFATLSDKVLPQKISHEE
jgi:hypothetical protein